MYNARECVIAVVDLETKRKRIYDFLLVITSNLYHVLYRF